MGRVRILLFVLILVLSSVNTVEARRKKSKTDELVEAADDNIPQVPYLIEIIGQEIYRAVNRPKYKLYIYMTIGKLPNEENTIFLLNLLCNFLYGTLTLLGFLFFPRGYMLLATLLTLFVGPALVLMLLGATALTMAAFACYPLYSVMIIWVFFFLTSRIAQLLGKRLGLDHDGDGDVDWMDLLHYVAQTRIGKHFGLINLHEFINRSSMNPFLEINRRLDEIQNSTRAMSSQSLEASPQKNGDKMHRE